MLDLTARREPTDQMQRQYLIINLVRRTLKQIYTRNIWSIEFGIHYQIESNIIFSR